MSTKVRSSLNDYPAFFKRGTFIQKRTVQRAFTSDEIEHLPEKHEARHNPSLRIQRSEIRRLDMPPFAKVTNRVAVIFSAADPKIESDSETIT